MVQLVASRRLLHVVALAVCSLAMVALATPASARSHHHGAGRHGRAHHHHHHVKHTRHRHFAQATRMDAGFGQSRAPAFTQASVSPAIGFGSSNVVAEARRYIGGNPTGRGSLWCARFMNMVLQHTGLHGTGSDMASSFAHYGQRVSGPQIGAIAVMGRRGGGHVGVVSGIDASGNPIVVSGNHGHRVAESVYPRGRIYAYVMPAG
ncbi:MAG TPA: TIGR02594 family protein [Bradyrhizobium sp.]|nr:TIGR02594 family protein [Bradyrhizobium sp.]